MKHNWSTEELAAQWSLLPSEREFLGNKTGATRLGFAALLQFFQAEGRFPRQAQEVPEGVVAYISRQVGVEPAEWLHYAWQGRTIEYHRAQIRARLGFRQATVEDAEALAVWLEDRLLGHDRQMDRLEAAVHERCRFLRIEPPTPDRIERLIRTAIAEYERKCCEALLSRLSPEAQAQLNALLLPTEPLLRETEQEPGRAFLHELRADPGRASLESTQEEIAKLERVRCLNLPPDLFAALSPQVLRAYRQRVSAEEPHELRRHPVPLRATLLAAFCYLRGQEITDNLVDLLIDTVHRIGAKAEQRVERELIEDLKRVSGKNGL